MSKVMACCACGCRLGISSTDAKGRSRRFVQGHNTRGRRILRPFKPLKDRLMAKVSPEPDSTCWIWLGARNQKGYGIVGAGGHRGNVRAHVAAYRIFREEVPAGLVIDHLCRRRVCVNPWHLEAVTQAENLRRAHA